jgi:hypothetical protein
MEIQEVVRLLRAGASDRDVVKLVAVELRSRLQDLPRDRRSNDPLRFVDAGESPRQGYSGFEDLSVFDDQVVAALGHDPAGLRIVTRDNGEAFHGPPFGGTGIPARPIRNPA